ncbi:MAG: tRNA pseudouridine(13) synthase TruD, partial [Candidatus Woesearchaeota archaeon]
MILKQSPEDFIVEEIPLNQWNDAGPYAVFSLIKIGLNTEQAIDIINKRFHFPSNIIKYSGTKDRHAHTTQYISIPTRPNIEKIYLDEEALKLKHVGFLDEPLSLGTLKGNRFIITLRDITDADLAAFKSKGLDKFMIPNYFDEQRFSKNNYDIGLCILKKDYKKATEYLCEGSDIYSDSIRVYLTAYPNDYISALKKIPRKTLLMF